MSPISNFMKISPVGAELTHEDRRADMTQLISGAQKLKDCRQDEQSQRNAFKHDTRPTALKYVKTECRSVRPEKAALRALWA